MLVVPRMLKGLPMARPWPSAVIPTKEFSEPGGRVNGAFGYSSAGAGRTQWKMLPGAAGEAMAWNVMKSALIP